MSLIIKIHQKRLGLQEDGVAGKKTIAALIDDLHIKTPMHAAHFFAQVEHESGGFRANREDAQYSEARLLEIFPRSRISAQNAHKFAGNAPSIANMVYQNRMGNGDFESGDGYRYRGLGGLQLTGKTNHLEAMKAMGYGENDHQAFCSADNFFESALYYFDKNDVWQYCNDKGKNNFTKASKLINFGNADAAGKPNGMEERWSLFLKYTLMLNLN